MDAAQNGGVDISVEHLVAWYKTDAGLPVGETTPLQKVIIAVTQLRQKKQTFGDRAALIVTAHESGAVLFDKIIEKDWTVYDDDQLQDPTDHPRCCIVIVEEHGTGEGFGEMCNDGHDFQFANDQEYARFCKLIRDGQELAGLYHGTLREVLITGILNRGEHRPALVVS